MNLDCNLDLFRYAFEVYKFHFLSSSEQNWTFKLLAKNSWKKLFFHFFFDKRFFRKKWKFSPIHCCQLEILFFHIWWKKFPDFPTKNFFFFFENWKFIRKNFLSFWQFILNFPWVVRLASLIPIKEISVLRT